MQVYENNSSNLNSDSDVNLKRPFIYRLFSCCIQRPKANLTTNSSNTSDFINTGQTIPREPLTRKPAKMPDIYSTTQPKSKKCLVLDLDETLVHSSFQVHITIS